MPATALHELQIGTRAFQSGSAIPAGLELPLRAAFWQGQTLGRRRIQMGQLRYRRLAPQRDLHFTSPTAFPHYPKEHHPSPPHSTTPINPPPTPPTHSPP